jgi:pilus assembly protein CpaE
LVDLDVRFGTAALSLDLETGGGLVDALHNPDRLDGLFIERAMVRESENLYVLGSEEALDDQVGFDPQALDLLVERLRCDFPRVVIDVPRHEACEHPGLIAAADTILVVSDLSLAGMRDTLRLVRLAAGVAPAARLVVIANRVGAAKKGEIPKADFAKGIERPVDHVVPFDIKSHVATAVTGKALPIVAKRGPSVVALTQLVKDIAEAEPVEKKSWFSRNSAKGKKGR